MRHNHGLTLLEVLVAVVILAVGVLAGAAMQTNALRANRQAAVTQRLASLAQAELETQRQGTHSKAPESYTACQTGSVQGYSCRITVLPCSLQSTTVNCVNSTLSADPAAHRVNVTTTGPTGLTFSVSTLVLFVAA